MLKLKSLRTSCRSSPELQLFLLQLLQLLLQGLVLHLVGSQLAKILFIKLFKILVKLFKLHNIARRLLILRLLLLILRNPLNPSPAAWKHILKDTLQLTRRAHAGSERCAASRRG